ncbi:hypothetical protein D9M71_748080 [compost metagenome]
MIVHQPLRWIAGQLQASGADEFHGPVAVVAAAIDQPRHAVQQVHATALTRLQGNLPPLVRGDIPRHQIEAIVPALQTDLEPAQFPRRVDEPQPLVKRRFGAPSQFMQGLTP